MKKLLPSLRRHDITVCRNGLIIISAFASKALNIIPGDSINIIVDNSEFYLTVERRAINRIGRGLAVCRPSKLGSRNMYCNCVYLANAFLNAVGVTNNKARFLVGNICQLGSSVGLPIISHNPLL